MLLSTRGWQMARSAGPDLLASLKEMGEVPLRYAKEVRRIKGQAALRNADIKFGRQVTQEMLLTGDPEEATDGLELKGRTLLLEGKAQAALASSVHPIVCVGETLQEREAGQVEAVITTQVQGSLAGLSAKEMLDSVIAYEPVWAIGTGKTASSEQAQEVHALIRQVLTGLYDATVAQAVRIQYGGSVKPANARELFAMPDIDGGLIGGAALDAKSFIDIVRAAV